MRFRTFFWLFMTVFLSFPAISQEIGPSNGHLVIVGGAADSAIIESFVDLAGGSDANIVVIPTAGGAESYDKYWPGLRPFRNAGAHNLTVLHTNDRAVADSDAFVDVIRNADAVWFGGGRQWRLADSYLNTATHDALWELLERGGGDRGIIGRRNNPRLIPGTG